MPSGSPHRSSWMLRILLLALILPATDPALGALRGAPADDAHLTDELPAAVARIFPGLVRIRAVMEEPGPGRIVRLQGSGSGIIISREGHVITNHHVAGNATYLVCDLPDRRDLPARLIGTDPLADIAVVQIDLAAAGLDPRDLSVAPWGDSDALGIGTEVFAMGSPAAISQSVTRGIIANPRMTDAIRMPMLDGEDVGSIVRWLVHDATIFGGNSGGPLVNARGEIIGINEIGFANLAGAIPGNLARSVAEEIIADGEVARSWLGLSIQPRLDREPTDGAPAGRGALVASVRTDGPADRAGIRVGDLLLEADGREIDCGEVEELPIANGVLFDLPIGSPFEVRLLRDDTELRLDLTAELRGKARAPIEELRDWGVTYSNPTRALRFTHELPPRPGIIILGVRQGSPADSATPPLQPGDLIVRVGEREIDGTGDFASASAEILAGEEDATLLGVRRGPDDLLVWIEGRQEAPPAPSARVRRPVLPLSIQPVTGALAEALGLEDGRTAVRITSIPDDAPEAVAELRVGDLLLEIGGKRVQVRNRSDRAALQRLVRNLATGEPVEVLVIRDGAPTTVRATPVPPPETVDLAERTEIEDLGFSVRSLVGNEGSHRLAKTGAVAIEKVEAGGWADIGGLRVGDLIVSVDRQPTRDLTNFSTLLDGRITARASSIVLLVLRDEASRFIVLEPNWED